MGLSDLSIYDTTLLMYYRFDTPSGGYIQNRAYYRPRTMPDGSDLNTDLIWADYDGPFDPGIPGYHSHKLVDLTELNASGLGELYIPGQWGSPSGNPYTDNGHHVGISGNIIASYGPLDYSDIHGLRIVDNIDGTSISQAICSGDFTVGGWLKPATSIATYHGYAGFFEKTVDDPFAPISQVTLFQNNLLDRPVECRIVNGGTASVNCGGKPSGSYYNDGGYDMITYNYPWMGWNFVAFTVILGGDDAGNEAYGYLNHRYTQSQDNSNWDTLRPSHCRYFTINQLNQDQYSNYQQTSVWHSFFMFNRALSEDEIWHLMNNGISETPILTNLDDELLLWYRFVEASGVPVRSWAANTPTHTIDGSGEIDTNLYWHDYPPDPVYGLFSIQADLPAASGSWFPAQWDAQYPDQPRVCASGNTTNPFHAIRGENIDHSEISNVISSGSFTMALWVNPRHYSSYRVPFVWSKGGEDYVTLGLNCTTTSQVRIRYNDGTGSDKSLYSTSNPPSGYYWNHICLIHESGGFTGSSDRARLYVNGDLAGQTSNPDFDNLAIPYFLSFFNYYDEWEDSQFLGAVKDFVLYNRALEPFEIKSLFGRGINLIANRVSGVVGGYAIGKRREAHTIGGYIDAWAYQASGVFGGHTLGRWYGSGVHGGYLFCGNRQSGVFGGFIYSSGIASGVHGGYCFSVVEESGTVGGRTFSVLKTSGTCGGFVNCGLPGSGVFDASMRVKAITFSDVDALIEIQNTFNKDVDAQIEVYKSERPPFVAIEYPPPEVVSGVPPSSVWFVGSGVAVDGKTVDSAKYSFGDLSSHANGTPSGADQYVTTHTYANSGLYIATLRVTDSNGLIGSDSVVVNLASGVPLPDVEITANPRSGDAPLSVDFDYSITNIPAGVTITSTVLYFGNGKSTINPDTTYTYEEPGIYTPILCVVDSRGVITCDSLTIGVNN